MAQGDLACGDDGPIRITIATGKLNGLYFPIGSAICQFAHAQWQSGGSAQRCPHRCIAVPTSGSADNLSRLAEGSADFAIVQENMLETGGPQLVANAPPFLQETFLVMVAEDSELQSLADFKVEDPSAQQVRVFAGEAASGHRFTAEAVFAKAFDLLPDDTLDFLDIKEARLGDTIGERLCMDSDASSKLDAIVLTSGLQAPVVQQILADCETRILPVDPVAIADLPGTSVDSTFQMEAKLVARPGLEPVLGDLIESEGGAAAFSDHIARALLRFATSEDDR